MKDSFHKGWKMDKELKLVIGSKRKENKGWVSLSIVVDFLMIFLMEKEHINQENQNMFIRGNFLKENLHVSL